MYSIKKTLAVLLLCFFAHGVVDSCNSDTTGTSGSCILGTYKKNCGAACGCNSSLFLTCIDGQCECNLNARGDFGHSCNTDCTCNSIAGLICQAGKCLCNTTTSLWDINRCVAIEKTSTNCDPLVGTVVSTSIFKTTASETGWKCVLSSNTLYGPSYNETTGKGKYFVQTTPANAAASYTACKNINANRLLSKTGDEFELLIKSNYKSATFWVGVTKSNQDGYFYYDNNSTSVAALTPADTTNGCVTMVSDASAVITYPTAACTGTNKYVCVF